MSGSRSVTSRRTPAVHTPRPCAVTNHRTRLLSHTLVALCAASVLSFGLTSPLHAADPPPASQLYNQPLEVAVFASDAQWPKGFIPALLKDLRAGLTAQNATVARADVATGEITPRARVTLRRREANLVRIEVTVTGEPSEESLEREIDLSRVPARDTSLVLSIAIEEMIRVAFEQVRREDIAFEARIGEGTPRDPRTTRPSDGPVIRLAALGVSGFVEQFLSASTFVGADVSGRLFPTPWLTLQFGGQWSRAPRTTTQAGVVTGDHGALSIAAMGWRRGHDLRGLELGAGIWGAAGILDLRPETEDAQVEGRRATSIVADLGVTAALGWRWRSGWGVLASARAGFPARGVEVTDAASVGRRGLAWRVGIGVQWSFHRQTSTPQMP